MFVRKSTRMYVIPLPVANRKAVTLPCRRQEGADQVDSQRGQRGVLSILSTALRGMTEGVIPEGKGSGRDGQEGGM
jgi:hypothetical protein